MPRLIPSFVYHGSHVRSQLAARRKGHLQIPKAAEHHAFEMRVVNRELGEDRSPDEPERDPQKNIAPVHAGYSRHQQQAAKHSQQKEQFTVTSG